jgi:hypothetical protein
MHNAESLLLIWRNVLRKRRCAFTCFLCIFIPMKWPPNFFNKQNIAWEDYTPSTTSKIAAFYRNRKSITVFIRTRNRNLLWAILIHITWSHPMSVGFIWAAHFTSSLRRWLSFMHRDEFWIYEHFPSFPYMLHAPTSKERKHRWKNHHI